MSTNKSLSDQIKEIEYWLRLATLLHGPLKQYLLDVLHSNINLVYQGLPEDSTELYKELSTIHISTIKKLRKKGILKDDQLELLLPTNGDNKTFSEAFDITLLVILIINCTTLPSPVNGWTKLPLGSDTSIAANVIRAREWRNFLNHVDANAIDNTLFQSKWNEGIAIIQGLGGSVKDLGNLKTVFLDPQNYVIMQSLANYNERKTAHYLENELGKIKGELTNAASKFDTEIKQTKEKQNLNNDQIMHRLQSISSEVFMMKKENLETQSYTGILT